jgi:hypothetical protein
MESLSIPAGFPMGEHSGVTGVVSAVKTRAQEHFNEPRALDFILEFP